MSVVECFPDESIRVGSDRIDVLPKSALEELKICEAKVSGRKEGKSQGRDEPGDPLEGVANNKTRPQYRFRERKQKRKRQTHEG